MYWRERFISFLLFLFSIRSCFYPAHALPAHPIEIIVEFHLSRLFTLWVFIFYSFFFEFHSVIFEERNCSLCKQIECTIALVYTKKKKSKWRLPCVLIFKDISMWSIEVHTHIKWHFTKKKLFRFLPYDSAQWALYCGSAPHSIPK